MLNDKLIIFPPKSNAFVDKHLALHIGVDQVEDAHQAVAFLNMDLQTSFIGGFRGSVLLCMKKNRDRGI
jgi:hypothetical protein